MIRGLPFAKPAPRRTAIPVALLTGLLLLAGCGLDYERDATELADRLYAHLADSDYDGAAELYSDAFYSRISRDRWTDTLRQIDEQLGRYERHSLIQAREQTFGPDDDPGETFTVLMYRVHYGREQALEQLTFSTAQTPVGLVNHQVMSDLVAVNLDEDGERPIRVASADPGDRDTREQRPSGASESEPADVETAEAEPEEEVRPEPMLEDLIAAEVARLSDNRRDPDAERFVRQLIVNGINPHRNRILVDTRLMEEGEVLSREFPLTLKAVESRRIVFRDEAGTLYEKAFLTASH